MLYAFHEMQKSLGAPMRFAAQMGMTWAQSDGNPWKEMPQSDWLAASSELTLRPGDLVSAVVRSSADYDLAAEVVRVVQPAYRPPQAVKLRVLA